MEIASLTTTLAPLAFLACPVGMGVMMWFMAKGSKREQPPTRDDRAAPARPVSVEVLREEHRRLADEIERLERQEGSKAEAGEPR